MSNSTVWEAFKGLYDCVLSKEHNNQDLIRLWGEDPSKFETQILCNSDGTPVPDSKRFEEGGEEWGPMRWPYDSFKETAYYKDSPIKFVPATRVKAIGTTWWNWKDKQTIRLGFDIDSIIGHAPGVGVEQQIIEEISKADVPYLDIIRSTRGLGRHLYINFKEPYPIAMTHHEHAAIARSLLPRLSKDCGIDMEANKDVCGGIMWIHHVNANKDNRGYKSIKKATDALSADDVPVNWRDHLSVVGGSRNKVLVRGWTPDGLTAGDELDQMSQERAPISIEPAHEVIMDKIEDTGFTAVWVNDHNLYQTHTIALKMVFDEMKEKGTPLKGLFDTSAPGDDPGKPNCWMHPRLNGGWDVYRFGEGTGECPLWETNSQYTHTTFNVDFKWEKIMKITGGAEDPNPKKGFAFNTVTNIQSALDMMGSTLVLPQRANDGRIFYIRRREDKRLVLGISKERSDRPVDFNGFVKTPQGWESLLDAGELTVSHDEDTSNVALDDFLRALTRRNYDDSSTCGGVFAGWVLKDQSGRWVGSPRDNIRPGLKALGCPDVDTTIGNAVLNSWELINEPFQPEFPGGRKWNRDAPQFKYEPAQLAIDEKPHHPWWDKYYNHLGSDLDRYVTEAWWKDEYGIENGGDYLKAWVACMLRYPFDKLPYLFMYGTQETGKSMFHETISLLITKGVVSADRALTSESGYNGELLNAVLAYVDEVDVAEAGRGVYNMLKAWTTGLTIPIHAKYMQVFEAPNTLHFVQMANHLASLPVFQGDKRITAFEVPPIMAPIPKDEFMEHLIEEAPHFMRTLIDWDLPEAASRHRLPVIETDSKDAAIASSESVLDSFISDRCFLTDGERMSLVDFRDAFLACLEDHEKSKWTSQTLKRELIKLGLPVGLAEGKANWIGNLTLDSSAKASTRYTIRDKRLVIQQRDN